MAGTWTDPTDKATNDVITAAIWNQFLGDTGNLQYLYDTLFGGYGSSTTEVTATSGLAADYVTISGLSIAAGKPFRVKCVFRKTSGAAVAFALGLKVNSTVVLEAQVATGKPRTSATNQAEDGICVFDVYPGETNYQNAISWQFWAYVSSTGAISASSLTDAAATNGPANLSAVMPAATVTSITIRGIGNGSMTTGVKNVYVEAI